MSGSKDPVRLRRRERPSGLVALFLDIYTNGKRKHEYLSLFLVPENNRIDKEHNRETLKLAEAIRAKRLLEVRNGEYGFSDGGPSQVLFFEYYDKMVEERRGAESLGNWGNWACCRHHLHIYEKRQNITFGQITPEWVQGFRNYLDNSALAWAHDTRKRPSKAPLAQNSKQSYFNKLRACLNQAYEQRIIQVNPARGIEGFKSEEGTRMYLTIDEVRKLSDTPCRYPEVKTAFLFGCLTGLRRSDIERLKWEDVHEQGEYTRIIFKQKKTKGQEYLDIAPQAAELMGERGKATERVFEYFMNPSETNRAIREWAYQAGISKRLSFHCSRHTFAVMMLDLGTDIYTVSKLLGHRELSTTQIYAKVLDKNKQAAVSSIPRII